MRHAACSASVVDGGVERWRGMLRGAAERGQFWFLFGSAEPIQNLTCPVLYHAILSRCPVHPCPCSSRAVAYLHLHIPTPMSRRLDVAPCPHHAPCFVCATSSCDQDVAACSYFFVPCLKKAFRSPVFVTAHVFGPHTYSAVRKWNCVADLALSEFRDKRTPSPT